MHRLGSLGLLLVLLCSAWPAEAQTIAPVRNFALVTVSTGYDSTATTVVLSSGDGAKLPPTAEGSYWLVWWNDTDYPGAPHSDPNREVVLVTTRSSDTLTLTRGQDGTTAVNHNTSGKTYKMLQGWLKANVDQLRSAITGVSGAIPNVADCSAYASCNALVSAIGSSAQKTARLSTSQTVASNLTWSNNYTVWPIGAGQFSISSSVTVTFQSPDQIIYDRVRQIFTGAGSPTGVVFTKPGTVYPRWWGAACDGSTDDGPEIQSAIDSLPSTGGIVDLRDCGVFKLNQELSIAKNDVTILMDASTTIDITTIAGTGTTSIHDTNTVIAAFKLTNTGNRAKIIGGRITGVATVSSKHTVGILCHGCQSLRVGGTRIDGLYAGVWLGNNALDVTIQNVELSSNSRNLLCGYLPVTSPSPQVTRLTLLNVIARNATVGDGVQLASHCTDTRIYLGSFFSNAGHGINGSIGGGTATVQGALAFSNTGDGYHFTYDANSGTIANKLGFTNRLTLLGNTARANTGDGFSVQLTDYSLFTTLFGVEDVLIEGNLSVDNVDDCYELGLTRSVVSGNRALSCDDHGFVFRSLKSVTIKNNQSWDHGTGGDNGQAYLFTTAATSSGSPPASTLVTFEGNHGGDTRAGGSRTVNFTFEMASLNTSVVKNNVGTNANTADWHTVNGLTAVTFLDNLGTVSGSDVIGHAHSKWLSGTATYDPPSMNAGDYVSTTVTVTGASVGDPCFAGHSSITTSLFHVTCHVTAANTVTVVIRNATTSTVVDPASGTATAEVVKR